MTPVEASSLGPVPMTALVALFGSLVGALGSSVSTWITQKHQDRRDLLGRNIFHREELYSDFISESTRISVDALENNFKDANKLIPVYALLSRIRLSSSREVLESAEEVVRNIIITYTKPNLTLEEIRARAVKDEDPLRGFSEVCRVELESIQKQL